MLLNKFLKTVKSIGIRQNSQPIFKLFYRHLFQCNQTAGKCSSRSESGRTRSRFSNYFIDTFFSVIKQQENVPVDRNPAELAADFQTILSTPFSV